MHFKTQLRQTNITLATTTGIPTPGWKTFHKSKHNNKNRAGAKQLVQQPNTLITTCIHSQIYPMPTSPNHPYKKNPLSNQLQGFRRSYTAIKTRMK